MLIKNILIKTNSKTKIRTANDTQLKLMEKSPYLRVKAETAQKLYNRSILYIFIYFFGIILISLFDDNCFIYKFGSLAFTAIAIPTILSLNNLSFDLMKDIDNETIWKNEESASDPDKVVDKDNSLEINLLEEAIKHLSRNNDILEKSLNAQLQSKNYKKNKRKYK